MGEIEKLYKLNDDKLGNRRIDNAEKSKDRENRKIEKWKSRKIEQLRKRKNLKLKR